ncbi:MAG: sialidase family protein [Promethearchaeota archaeon]
MKNHIEGIKFLYSNLIYEKIDLKSFPFAHCSSITQIAPDPNEINSNLNKNSVKNELMAVWYSGKAEQSKNQSIFASFFNYELQSNMKINGNWSKPFILSKSIKFPEGNPVIWKDFETNNLFLFYAIMETENPIKKAFGRGWFHCKLFYKISKDNGKSWSNPKVLKDELGYMVRNKPIRLKSKKGRILLPMYKEVPPRSLIAISDDDGISFRFSELIEDHEKYPRKRGLMGGSGNTQPTIVELENGVILALMRTRLHKKIFRSISEDYGETWTRAEEINLPNPDSGIDMIKTFQNKLLLVFNNTIRGRNKLSIAISDDNLDTKDAGKHWKVIGDLEYEPKKEFSYPCIIQDYNNLIHITYTFKRKTIKHVVFCLVNKS